MLGLRQRRHHYGVEERRTGDWRVVYFGGRVGGAHMSSAVMRRSSRQLVAGAQTPCGFDNIAPRQCLEHRFEIACL